MGEAPTSESEDARLAALHALEILDSEPETAFNRLVRMTAQLFDAPIAHISLIDEHREWLKAGYGATVCEGDRSTAFCAHTIHSDGVLIVEDATLDQRFRDNPKVCTEPGIRFYAGAPLLTRSGQAIGAICIKDHVPRTLTQRQIEALGELACITIEMIEHRLVAAELRRWEFVFNHAEWGIAMADAGSATFKRVNEGFAAMHGYTPGELQGRPIPDVFAPGFRDEALRQLARVEREGHAMYEAVHLRKDGTTFPVAIDVVAVRDARGRLRHRAAFVQDITERRRLDEELLFKNTILATQQEASPDGILIVDHHGKAIGYNQRFAKMWNTPPEILEAEDPEEGLRFAMGQVADPRAFRAQIRHLDRHPRRSSNDQLRMKDGRVFDRHSAPMLGPNGEHFGRVWYLRDVTARVRAERAVRESETRLSNVLESAMDAIVAIDGDDTVRLFNHAAEEIFGCSAATAIGQRFERFMSRDFAALLRNCRKAFGRRGSHRRCVWAPEGLTALRADGREFPIEATISRVDARGDGAITLILRDVDERVAAERVLESLQAQNVYLQEQVQSELGFEEIVARSRPMLRVLETVRQVAPTESTVLLLGETGTGKELIARAIHRLGARSDKMMVKVNCAALPAGLIESELFGHEKGAFTGAIQRKVGRFELAHGGTIFLDEVGDLPLELQAKLLRVLQEGELERVGGAATIRVDVRVLAATNRDLAAEVDAGRYRADLYYRLAVFPVEIPPLRERPADVPLLVNHFALKHAARTGKKIVQVPEQTMAALGAYDWPGNVRELQNVIERAVILSTGGRLNPGSWLPTSRSAASAGLSRLADVERNHILAILDRTDWRVSGVGGAAELLGLKRTTLESRMKKLGIERPRRPGHGSS